MLGWEESLNLRDLIGSLYEDIIKKNQIAIYSVAKGLLQATLFISVFPHG